MIEKAISENVKMQTMATDSLTAEQNTKNLFPDIPVTILMVKLKAEIG